jgi:hypothetical protein
MIEPASTTPAIMASKVGQLIYLMAQRDAWQQRLATLDHEIDRVVTEPDLDTQRVG